jgi:CheY-like chemotaxis protein
MSTVLVVDDSKFSRGRVVAALEPLGYEIVQAANGQEGLQSYDQRAPDLIVTDLLMPTLDGFGLLRGLRERCSPTPVIVLSADIQSTSRKLCEELGVKAFLNKPFRAEELAAKVQQALQSAAAVP